MRPAASIGPTASGAVAEPPARLLLLFGGLLGPLLGGYLLFDKAFAYLHVPGTPLFVGELVLGVGVLGVLAATRYLVTPLREEPILALLAAYALWGALRLLPGLHDYGIDAVRDSALWYYCLSAFLILATLAHRPAFLNTLLGQLGRLAPWLLLWLPIGLILQPRYTTFPLVPFTGLPILSHKPGNAALAALLVLGYLWLLPDERRTRLRWALSLLALLVIAMSATQNRGGLLGAAAGALVGLAYLRGGLRLAVQALVISALGLGLATTLAVKVPFAGVQGREFSAAQLVQNIVSVGGAEDSPGNLAGTVDGRRELWVRILDKQVDDGRLVDGSGFGPNIAADVGEYDEGKETLRNPHNSHLHILARMGLVGIALWVALWSAWYWRMLRGCGRLARAGRHRDRQIAVLCMMFTTSVLVSTFFDPQLEGPTVSIPLWTVFGIGIAVTSTGGWSRERDPDPRPAPPTRPAPAPGD